jgi:YHS domain-containing protein
MIQASLVGAAVLAIGLGAFAPVQDSKKPADSQAESKPARAAKVEVPFFGNSKCPVSGEDVDKSAMAELDGQAVYFCCKKCLAKGREDVKGTLAKAYPEGKVVDLKNTMCPVMDEAIEEDKAENAVVVMGRRVHTCCDDCPAEVKAAPALYLAKAANPKLKEVGNSKCPVTGEAVSRMDIAIYNGKVVRLANAKAIDSFQKDPEKFLAEAEKSVKKPEKKQ